MFDVRSNKDACMPSAMCCEVRAASCEPSGKSGNDAIVATTCFTFGFSQTTLSTRTSLGKSAHLFATTPEKIKMAIRDLLLLALLQVAVAASFSVSFEKPGMRNVFATRLAAAVDDGKAIQCFVVNEFEVEEEGADPEIVCTKEPDDYAWFNGLDRDAMKPTNGESESFLECVEGSSPKGVPEWECKKVAGDKSS